MATFSDSTRPLILDNILFEHIFKNKNDTGYLDDTKLKKLNSIMTNIPYNMLKQSYDTYQRKSKIENKIIEQTEKMNSHNTHHHHNHNHNHHRNHNNHSQLQTHAKHSNNENNATNMQHKNKHAADSDYNFSSESSSNLIVIHVCDESKQLRKDFTCPRDLLVKEMKYFTNNINLNSSSNNGQSSVSTSALSKRSLDDIDISVHCDINIFDWLMRYVKRNLNDSTDNEKNEATDETREHNNENEHSKKSSNTKNKEPKLEISNCVSILISSDFLIMNELVDKCILFMIENFNQILQIPCNMNTINDRLITRIGAFIKVQQLEELVDKKDKFKAKLFMKKIEFLFDIDKWKQQFQSLDNGDDLVGFQYEDDANTLFRCKICGRIMTKRQSSYVKCQLGILDKRGNYNYFHLSDEKFDVNTFVIEVKERLKTWQNVFWFLWALVKCVKCQVCKEWFRFVDFNKCPSNENSECNVHKIEIRKTRGKGNDPERKSITLPCTCSYKDHVIDKLSFNVFYNAPFSPATIMSLNQCLIEDLMKHKEIICFGNGAVSSQSLSIDGTLSFCNVIESHFRMLDNNSAYSGASPVSSFFLDSITGQHISFFNKSYLSLIYLANNASNEATLNNITQLNLSDITTYLNSISSLDPLNAFNSFEVLHFLKADPKKKWDHAKPARWNQDNQREDDTRRFREMTNFIIKLRILSDNSLLSLSNKLKQQISREPIGGFYCRIENEWKQRQIPSNNTYFSQVSVSSINSNNSNPSLSTNYQQTYAQLQNKESSVPNYLNKLDQNSTNPSTATSSSFGNTTNKQNNKLKQGVVSAVSKFSNN